MAKEQTLFKTAEVLRRAPISRQVLYRYISMELIAPSETTDTGRQLFEEKVFKQIAMIQRLNNSGYTLRDIREIFAQRLRNMK